MNGQDEHKADNARRTPMWLIESARQLMGGIDLDPASDLEAQRTVKARTWYGPGPGVIDDWHVVDGLQAPWVGRVWLNPPGGYMPDRTSSAAHWWGVLIRAYLARQVTQACFLAFSLNVFRTGQDRGHAPYSFPFVVFKDRIRFESSAGATVTSPNVDSALVYLPPVKQCETHLDAFQSIFSRYGVVRI